MALRPDHLDAMAAQRETYDFCIRCFRNTAWKTSESDSKKLNTSCSKADAVGAKACTLVKFSDACAVDESKPELPAAGSNVSCHEAADPKGPPSS